MFIVCASPNYCITYWESSLFPICSFQRLLSRALKWLVSLCSLCKTMVILLLYADSWRHSNTYHVQVSGLQHRSSAYSSIISGNRRVPFSVRSKPCITVTSEATVLSSKIGFGLAEAMVPSSAPVEMLQGVSRQWSQGRGMTYGKAAAVNWFMQCFWKGSRAMFKCWQNNRDLVTSALNLMKQRWTKDKGWRKDFITFYPQTCLSQLHFGCISFMHRMCSKACLF